MAPQHNPNHNPTANTAPPFCPQDDAHIIISAMITLTTSGDASVADPSSAHRHDFEVGFKAAMAAALDP